MIKHDENCVGRAATLGAFRLGDWLEQRGSKAVSRGVPRRSKRHGQHERVAVAEEEEDEEEADEEYGEAEADSE